MRLRPREASLEGPAGAPAFFHQASPVQGAHPGVLRVPALEAPAFGMPVELAEGDPPDAVVMAEPAVRPHGVAASAVVVAVRASPAALPGEVSQAHAPQVAGMLVGQAEDVQAGKDIAAQGRRVGG